MSNYDPKRDEVHYRLTDTAKREQSEALRKEIEQQTKEFLKRGGKIKQIPIGPIYDQDVPFTISTPTAHHVKQQWKEHKVTAKRGKK